MSKETKFYKFTKKDIEEIKLTLKHEIDELKILKETLAKFEKLEKNKSYNEDKKELLNQIKFIEQFVNYKTDVIKNYE